MEWLCCLVLSSVYLKCVTLKKKILAGDTVHRIVVKRYFVDSCICNTRVWAHLYISILTISGNYNQEEYL